MDLAENAQIKIEQELEHNFLYNNDQESLHILISILDNKNFATYLKPKYNCMKYIISNLKKYFIDKPNQEKIIIAIRRQITEDINRYELSTYLNAYNIAHNDKASADKLERLALEKYGYSFLFEKKELLENSEDEEVLELKNSIFKKIEEDKQLIDDIKKSCIDYSDQLYKNKILNLDLNIDSQLTFFDNSIIEEDKNLDIKELEDIYKKILTYMINKVMEIFMDAYWCAVNEVVLKRYQ
ncbi:MAG: hypothetical protein Q4B52_00615 [Tissierellia bacterium]|nr:hypothetical protein [Tissierellia bacterium]